MNFILYNGYRKLNADKGDSTNENNNDEKKQENKPNTNRTVNYPKLIYEKLCEIKSIVKWIAVFITACVVALIVILICMS